jgi:hypothetical protein
LICFRDLNAFKSEIIVPEGRSKVQWVVGINKVIHTNQLQIAWLNPAGIDISGQRQKYSMTIEENTELNQVQKRHKGEIHQKSKLDYRFPNKKTSQKK